MTYIIAAIAIMVVAFVVRSWWRESISKVERELRIKAHEKRKEQLIEEASKAISDKHISDLVNEHNSEIASRDDKKGS